LEADVLDLLFALDGRRTVAEVAGDDTARAAEVLLPLVRQGFLA
jgi:hypothetical protein